MLFRIRGLDKSSVWKYTPGFIARPIIKKIKDVAGTNLMRRHNLNLQKNIDDVLEENVGLVHRNAELDSMNTHILREINEVKAEYKKISDAKNEFVKAARKVKTGKRDHLATVLTGESCRIDPGDLGKYGIDEALVRIARDANNEVGDLRKQNNALRKDSLMGIVGGVCVAHGADRLPLFVYHNGEMMYTSPKFDSMTENARYIVGELERNPDVKKKIDAGKKSRMEYCDGNVFFIPEKLRNDEVLSIAHYVPTKKGKATSTYAKYGGAAVKAIYKTLRSFDKSGLEFVNDGKS